MPVDLRSLEHRLLSGVQAAGSADAVVNGARVLSVLGEHAGVWLFVSAAGGALDSRRRPLWVRAGAAVFVSHAASVVLKRLVRRHRPQLAGVAALVGVPSHYSFPSSHTTSTTTAAVVLSPLLGRWMWLVAAGMGASRIVLGVHYPSDVAAGVLLGAVVGGVATRLP